MSAAKTRALQNRVVGSRPKVLAVASAGGHWQQLMRLRAAFDSCELLFVSTNSDNAADVPHDRLEIVTDSNRDHPFKLVRTAAEIFRCVWAERPDVVISTGAAPGLLAILFGRLLGARTLWIDSIANAEEVSLSGRIAVRLSHRSLTQWPHLATERGPEYRGAVL